MCVASLEITLVLATLADRVEMGLLSDPDPELTAGTTLRPAEEVRVGPRRRS